MDNYIMLNGKKIPLTPEQVKLIQVNDPKSPFDRAKIGEHYYDIDCYFDVEKCVELEDSWSDISFEIGNYCTDETIMKQHALHMQLNNLLWRYSMTHGWDEIDWNDQTANKYTIVYDKVTNRFALDYNYASKQIGVIYFYNQKSAIAAIEEVVNPFIAAHPDFDVTKM